MVDKKLFVLGNPGSGKSTVVQSIKRLIDQHIINANGCEHNNDYIILQHMHKQEQEKRDGLSRFKTEPHGGFCVTDIQAFDEALQLLERQIEEQARRRLVSCAELLPADNTTFLIVIEFSRNDYERAFRQFHPAFLQDAHFLYLDTHLEVCKHRIIERIQKPEDQKTADDYYVPDTIFNEYYNKDAESSLFFFLEEQHIGRERLLLLSNNEDSPNPMLPKIQAFLDSLVRVPVTRQARKE
jgi:energy-coupling factor transporter ATP-binding protein EcfA2